jgi:processive 1,2-diacylglycerol beta-glucosyltransferase
VVPDAVLLSGSLGLGHEMMMRSCASVLERSGWRTRGLDSMALLGPRSGAMGERLFGRLVAVPGIYDGLHFAHLRTGSRLADFMGRRAAAKLVPALEADLDRRPADLVLSVFATGAWAAAKLKARAPGRRTVVLSTDVNLHRIWVCEGTDLFLVTSPAAAASVRRFLPKAAVSIVPPPVRAAFYAAPSQQVARRALGIPPSDPCMLMIDSGWGVGPLVESVAALARAGVHVLAVAGRQRTIERRLRALARTMPRVMPFGFTDRVPELMAAADVVLALPGANTCGEARVVGRRLLLLDVMPGHWRDNLQHELELGAAEVCGPSAAGVTASALAMLDKTSRPAPPSGLAPRWEPAFIAALHQIGLDLRPDHYPDAAVPVAALAGGPDHGASPVPQYDTHG